MSGLSASDAVTSMLHAIDRLDWPAIRQAFADRVIVDYSSLSGDPAANVAADDLIAGWRGLLPGFDATQHLTGPVLVSADGASAVARTHVRGDHHITGVETGDTWMVAGHYTVRLVEYGGQWHITALTLTVFYQESNLVLPELARTRAASTPRGPERP